MAEQYDIVAEKGTSVMLTLVGSQGREYKVIDMRESILGVDGLAKVTLQYEDGREELRLLDEFIEFWGKTEIKDGKEFFAEPGKLTDGENYLVTERMAA